MRFCLECKSLMETSIHETLRLYTIYGKDVYIKYRFRVCNKCKSRIRDEELDYSNFIDSYKLFRDTDRILTPKDIKSIRIKYGLSQISFSRVLGFSDYDILDYENGIIPIKAHTNLICLVSNPINFKILLENNSYLLSDEDYINSKLTIDRLMKDV